MHVLDGNKNGLIESSDLQKAIIQVVTDNNLSVDTGALTEMIEAVYTNDDGSKQKQISRKSIREALVNLPEIKATT